MTAFSFTPALADADVKHMLDAAVEAALQAGEIQRKALGQSRKIETKRTGIDLVTDIDKQCDALIREHLRRATPDALLVTEETFQEMSTHPKTPGDENAFHADLSHAWIVDPLDGTTNFAHGFPHFAVSIAYVRHAQPVIGVIYDVCKQELFTAVKGGGALLNQKPIHVSPTTVLNQALLATGFPYDIATSPENNLNHFAAIATHAQGVRRPGAAALDLAYTACGRFDAYWELKLSPWDIAAGMLLLEEAGGCVTDFAGKPLSLTNRFISLLGSNRTDIHAELVQLLV